MLAYGTATDKPDTDALDAIESIAALDPFATIGIESLKNFHTGEVGVVDFFICYENPVYGPRSWPLHSICIDGLTPDTRRASWVAVAGYLRSASAILANAQRYSHPAEAFDERRAA